VNKIRGLLALVAVWAAVFAMFSALKPDTFPTSSNVETILRHATIAGFASLGMTFVIISGAIDLSVGSAVALVTVVIAFLIQEAGVQPYLAAAGGILSGVICGLLNGLLVTRLRVTSFIVTLGTFLAFRGLAKGIAHEQKIDAPMTWLTDLMSALAPDKKWLLVPSGVWVLLISALFAAWLLKATVFGRNVLAVGGNEPAAELSGIRPRVVRLGVFLIMGLFAGLAGLMQFSRTTVGDPTAAMGLELQVIAAVVIGGASLSGGQGSIGGSLMGALLMTTIAAGSISVGIANWIQEIITGCIIVGAVWLDRLRTSQHNTA
jgi:ribose/xylose/arabinose/galactoside ABC-type transport system permease subunit